jgi:hypothetical protein
MKREFLKELMTEFRASARVEMEERYPELRAGKLPPMPKGFVMPPLPPGFVLADGRRQVPLHFNSAAPFSEALTSPM